MKKEVISGEGFPQSTLPFSPALKVNNLVFVSGHASEDEKGNIVAELPVSIACWYSRTGNCRDICRTHVLTG